MYCLFEMIWVRDLHQLIDLPESADKIEKFLIESNKKTIGKNLNESILNDTYSVFVERYDNENGGFVTITSTFFKISIHS